MQKKTLFFAGAFVCLLAAGWGYYQYQKPRARAADLVPAFHLTAKQLYAAYSSDEVGADKKYTGQVLEVSGVVKEVQKTETAINVLLAGDANGGVNCLFEKGSSRNITVNQQVKVKGRCTGFLMDVNLVDAVQVIN